MCIFFNFSGNPAQSNLKILDFQVISMKKCRFRTLLSLPPASHLKIKCWVNLWEPSNHVCLHFSYHFDYHNALHFHPIPCGSTRNQSHMFLASFYIVSASLQHCNLGGENGILTILRIFLKYFAQDCLKCFKTSKILCLAELSFKLDHYFFLGLIGSQA